MLDEAVEKFQDPLNDLNVFQSKVMVARLEYAFHSIRKQVSGGFNLQGQANSKEVRTVKLLWLLSLTTLITVCCLSST